MTDITQKRINAIVVATGALIVYGDDQPLSPREKKALLDVVSTLNAFVAELENDQKKKVEGESFVNELYRDQWEINRRYEP